jgi:hypothetical protein
MTPFEAYREYVALKSHFTSKSYDYIKFNGKVKTVTIDSYHARKDKIFFMRLAKHKDVKGFLISNFIETDFWVGDLAYNETAQKNYLSWQKRLQSLTYTFNNDLSKLKDDFDSNVIVENNDHPYLLKLFLRKDISFETLVILVDLVQCYSHWNKNMKNDPVWKDIGLKIKKYNNFLNYDKEKIRQIVIDRFS